MNLTKIKSMFMMFGRRTFSLVASIFIASIGLGIMYFSYNSVKEYIALADDGELTVAEITNYEFKERTTRRKGRTRRHTYHTHTIAYDGYTNKIDLDKEYPTGSGLKILYSQSNPSNFILSSDKPSLSDLILREVGWGYLIFIPLLLLFIGYWAWEKFDVFLDPLGEREMGLKFRFPKNDHSSYRQWLSKEVDEVNANGKDPMMMILMGMICSFEVKTDKKSEELGKLNDLSMFEIGSFLFITMSQKTDDPIEKEQIAGFLNEFIFISTKTFQASAESLNTLVIHRIKSYKLLEQMNTGDSVKRALSGFISESLKLPHPTLTSYISPKTSEEHGWLPQEVDKWFSHCDPMTGNLIKNKALLKKAA